MSVVIVPTPLRCPVSYRIRLDTFYQELIEADLFDVNASFVMEALKQTTELPL